MTSQHWRVEEEETAKEVEEEDKMEEQQDEKAEEAERGPAGLAVGRRTGGEQEQR